METLTLEHASNYLPHKLKVLHTEFEMEGCYTQVVTLSTAGEECLTFTDHKWGASDYHYEVESNPEIKFILRSMDLTKPIQVDGKEIIPIVELFNIGCGNNADIYGVSIKQFSGYIKISTSIEELRYLPKVNCFIYKSLGDEGEEWNPPFNQLALFKKLYEWKMDVYGLIDLGLAIDADTLPVNPYNT